MLWNNKHGAVTWALRLQYVTLQGSVPRFLAGRSRETERTGRLL